MSFEVAADAYDRFMGRYSSQLSPALADFGGVRAGQRVLDVGCGPGALTAELARRLGPDAVAAVDPSESFVAEARAHRASTVGSPWRRSCLTPTKRSTRRWRSSSEPVAGLAEMPRVTRADGVVAACVWDLAGGRAPISTFWKAAPELDSSAEVESGLAWRVRVRVISRSCSRRPGCDASKRPSSPRPSSTRASTTGWGPFTLGVGPAGSYARTLHAAELSALRERCRELLPKAPFTVTAVAWTARGIA